MGVVEPAILVMELLVEILTGYVDDVARVTGNTKP